MYYLMEPKQSSLLYNSDRSHTRQLYLLYLKNTMRQHILNQNHLDQYMDNLDVILPQLHHKSLVLLRNLNQRNIQNYFDYHSHIH